VIVLHGFCPAVGDRWGYYLGTLEAGSLLDGPIPQVDFVSPDRHVLDLLHGWACLVGHDHGGWKDFCTLIDWLAWGLGVAVAPPPLTVFASQRLYRHVHLAPLLERPHDYLGSFLSRSNGPGWNPRGLRPAPHLVLECLVRATLPLSHNTDPRRQKIHDRAAGTGRFLLHASNYSLDLRGDEADPLAVTLCRINGVLYAPWLAFPLPEHVLGLPSAE
jgi:hypothetical protein